MCVHVEPGLQIFIIVNPIEQKLLFEVFVVYDEAAFCQYSFDLESEKLRLPHLQQAYSS
jgi:hypothetical protein